MQGVGGEIIRRGRGSLTVTGTTIAVHIGAFPVERLDRQYN